jgi:hypothetical protein
MKGSFGKPRRRWEDTIRMDLIEMGREWAGFIWLRIRTSSGLL